jgi:hypothetical protein
LRFQQREWETACEDLGRARDLSPDNLLVSDLLERARQARDRLTGPGEASGTGGETDVGVVVERDSGAESGEYWGGYGLRHYRFDDQVAPDAVARMYSDSPFEAVDPRGEVLNGGAPDLSPEEMRRVVEVLEESFEDDPSRLNRRDLALAYVRSGRPADGRGLLLPLWDQDIALEERCIVLEADRALGDVTRARHFAQSLAEGAPTFEDPIFWSLVAFCCLDAGLNSEGLAALDAAIRFDPDNIALQNQKQFLNGMR